MILKYKKESIMYKSIPLSLFYLFILAAKGLYAMVAYPFVYPFYTQQEQKPKSFIKWFVWLHCDYAQPSYGPEWFTKDYCKCECDTSSKWSKFVCSYRWSALRNPMYNINYNYLSNHSSIMYHKVIFGSYDWNRKLRYYKGDRGVQLVTYRTTKGQDRFLFSLAKYGITFYFGWNASFDGRFTVALKYKKD